MGVLCKRVWMRLAALGLLQSVQSQVVKLCVVSFNLALATRLSTVQSSLIVKLEVHFRH